MFKFDECRLSQLLDQRSDLEVLVEMDLVEAVAIINENYRHRPVSEVLDEMETLIMLLVQKMSPGIKITIGWVNIVCNLGENGESNYRLSTRQLHGSDQDQTRARHYAQDSGIEEIAVMAAKFISSGVPISIDSSLAET